MNYSNTIQLGLLTFLMLLASCNEDKKTIPAPEIHLKMINEVIEMELGDTLLLSPKITYDIDGSYQWLINDSLVSTEKNISHTSEKMGKIDYKFVVKTAYGQDSMKVPVSTIIKINFNELELKSESYDTGTKLVDSTGGFVSGVLFLPVNPQEENYWTGFALSNILDKQLVANPSAFAAYANATKQKENKFMVYNQPQTPDAAAIEFEGNSSYVIGSISVANTHLSHLVMKYGTENGIRPFGGETNDQPDWCKLIIEGFDANGTQTDTVNFYLADYRFANKRKNYIVSDWSTVDLQKLGKVNKVVFSITSSVTDAENNVLTPKQFCLDEMKLVE